VINLKSWSSKLYRISGLAITVATGLGCVPLYETTDLYHEIERRQSGTLKALAEHLHNLPDDDWDSLVNQVLGLDLDPVRIPSQSAFAFPKPERFDALIAFEAALSSSNDIVANYFDPSLFDSIRFLGNADSLQVQDIYLDSKRVEIISPITSFEWPESGAFIQPITIHLNRLCDQDCTSMTFSGRGLFHIDLTPEFASIRNMELTSPTHQSFTGNLNFNIDKSQQNIFFDEHAKLYFRLDDGKEMIRDAIIFGAATSPSMENFTGGFGANGATDSAALLGYFSTD